ncbi:agmatine deiminase family protein [Actinomadura sp. NEAU-AAG5]|uniref:Agmatine deiminase family protein n=2 Tax=Thermomonosporaceae TaxID=2012 RepID=A0A7K1KZE1_9ACTN|nr:agmatine deiminase family protein [Actinomadura litoris]
MSRRSALRSLAGCGALVAGVAACSGSGDQAVGPSTATAGLRLGAEWEPQARTFMCWPTSDIWGGQAGAVQGDIAALARTIGGYQPVVMMARPELADAAQRACGDDVEVVPIPADDLWARDTVPVFVERNRSLAGVDLNFNGWGGKQEPHDQDARVARAVLAKYEIPRVATWLVSEGGALETDGQGTLLVTESSLVNRNRNPGKTRQQIEDELKRTLGVTKVIWFAGVAGKDITDAHIDCLVRFTAPGVVLLDRPAPGAEPDVWSRASAQAKQVLADATDARGRKLKVIELPQPDPDKITGRGEEFLSSYANFSIANKVVLLPRFGDAAADDHARQILAEQYPGREIRQLRIDNIAAGGGGIHCATHDQPRAATG